MFAAVAAVAKRAMMRAVKRIVGKNAGVQREERGWGVL
jgi:hypothetical protein